MRLTRNSVFRLARAASLLAPILSANLHAQTYIPPDASVELLRAIDFNKAVPLDETYRKEFVACDGTGPGTIGKDKFRGHSLRRPNKPETQQYYLCSRDPSNITALLKLADGAVYWQSKMALDVDGSWAAWNGIPGATDLKETSFKWPGSKRSDVQTAQIDPDRFPFVVMPVNGLNGLTGEASASLGKEFAQKTGLRLGDMGVVVYKNKWVPALIGDGGPFMRLGEGSSRVFEALGESRCKRWSADGKACIGNNGQYPYKNYGLGNGVIFILYPGSRDKNITPTNAASLLCRFANAKLKLTGGAFCPS